MSEKPGLLLTGATGFVGRHVIAAGRNRYAILATGRGPRPAWLPDEVAWQSVDLLNRESVAALPVALPFVVHLASETVPARFVNLDPLADSVEMTINLCRHLTAGRMLFASSCLVYGASERPLDEEAIVDPRGNYGFAKAIGESIVLQTSRINAVVARPFNHVGSGMRSDLAIPSIIRRVRETRVGEPIRMAGLNSIRDFLDVDDIVRAYFALLELTGTPASTFNVASGRATSIRDIVRKVARAMDKAIGPIEFAEHGNSADDTTTVVGDARLLREVTNWSPQVTLAESLNRLIAVTR